MTCLKECILKQMEKGKELIWSYDTNIQLDLIKKYQEKSEV